MGIQINGSNDTIQADDGSLSLAGSVSYEDVTNVTSVGLSTFSSGIHIDDSITHLGDTNTKIRFPAADTVTVETSGNEALRVNSSGEVSIGTVTGGKTLTLFGTSSSSFRILKSGVLAYDHTFDGSSYTIANNNGSAGIPLIIGTKTAGAESLRIDSSGVLTVGTTAAGSNAKFEVASTTGSISSATARINGGSTTTGAINTGASLLFAGHDGVNGRDYASLFAGKENGTSGNHAAYLAFGTRVNAGSTTEKMRIDSDGRVFINHTSDTAPAGYQSKLQLCDSGYNGSSISLRRDVNSTGGPALVFGKTRSTSKGGNTVVQNGDFIGSLNFYGGDGTDVNTAAASINCIVDGTPGSNDMPGRLTFHTTGDGSASPTERLRIDSSGHLQIGSTTSDSFRLKVLNGAGTLARFTDGTSQTLDIRQASWRY